MVDFMIFWDTNSVNEWHVDILRQSLGNSNETISLRHILWEL